MKVYISEVIIIDVFDDSDYNRDRLTKKTVSNPAALLSVLAF